MNATKAMFYDHCASSVSFCLPYSDTRYRKQAILLLPCSFLSHSILVSLTHSSFPQCKTIFSCQPSTFCRTLYLYIFSFGCIFYYLCLWLKSGMDSSVCMPLKYFLSLICRSQHSISSFFSGTR